MHLSRLHGKFCVAVVGALLISALAAGPALARRNRTPSTGSEQCWVTPNPLNQLPYVYTVWGKDFPPGMIVNVLVENALGTVVLLGEVGADRTFGTSSTATYTGTQEVYVRQSGDRQATNLAQCSFVVY